MKKIIYLFIIFVAGILQATLLDSFKVFGVKPDLLLISVIFAGLVFQLKWALVFGIVAGIFKDSLGANPFGINTILFPLWIFLVIKISRKIPLDNNLIRTALVSIIVVFGNLIARIIFFALGNPVSPLRIFLRVTFLELLYAAVILMAVFKVIRSLPYRIEIE